ncbi:MAG TPA: acetyl-CoA hydrolase/transferase C-terminal domain-containing protein [Thermoplasmata archaeon]|nr:acetyl-CoA hydrolase/transferase C-terminal domain-containing protein [Thermoplasmata archaeon]
MIATAERIRSKTLRARVMDSDAAVERFVPDRGSIAFSCMGGTSLAKEIPDALARSTDAGRRYDLTLLTGGATTTRFETAMARVGVRRRYPYLSEAARKAVNDGSVEFFDCRIGEFPELVREGAFTGGRPIDVAVVEATSIDERGRLVPGLAVDALPAFVDGSRQVIVELNEAKPDLSGLHDIYRVRPGVPLPIRDVRDRIGRPYVSVPASKIVAIVESQREDEPSGAYSRPSPTDSRIAERIATFLEGELKRDAWGGRFALQLGAGPLAAALMEVLPLRGADVWTEGIPLRWIAILGEQVRGISTTSMYQLPGDGPALDELSERLDSVLKHVVLRPYDVTNSLEVIARLNVVTIQQAIEVDLFGGANTSHIGRDAYNGVGGSPDFTRAARLVVVAMASTAAGGRYSRIVPLLSSSDIPRQDVDVLVTEQGHADLRGLSPRERAEKIIDRCSHPSFREGLSAYYRTVKEAGGHLPFSLEAAARFLGAQGRD